MSTSIVQRQLKTLSWSHCLHHYSHDSHRQWCLSNTKNRRCRHTRWAARQDLAIQQCGSYLYVLCINHKPNLDKCFFYVNRQIISFPYICIKSRWKWDFVQMKANVKYQKLYNSLKCSWICRKSFYFNIYKITSQNKPQCGFTLTYNTTQSRTWIILLTASVIRMKIKWQL